MLLRIFYVSVVQRILNQPIIKSWTKQLFAIHKCKQPNAGIFSVIMMTYNKIYLNIFICSLAIFNEVYFQSSDTLNIITVIFEMKTVSVFQAIFVL